MADLRICSVENCGKPIYAKSCCRKHYDRMRTAGTTVPAQKGAGPGLLFVETLVSLHNSDDCLEHPFKGNKAGYVACFFDGRLELLHRYVCRRFNGKPPAGKPFAAHECGNSRCVNPRHLAWKTQAENMADKIRHGTHKQGEEICNSVLTESQVLEIRSLHGTLSQRDIARRFGVGFVTVWHIIHRNTWKHLP